MKRKPRFKSIKYSKCFRGWLLSLKRALRRAVRKKSVYLFKSCNWKNLKEIFSARGSIGLKNSTSQREDDRMFFLLEEGFEIVSIHCEETSDLMLNGLLLQVNEIVDFLERKISLTPKKDATFHTIQMHGVTTNPMDTL